MTWVGSSLYPQALCSGWLALFVCVEEGFALSLVCTCERPFHRHLPAAFTGGQVLSEALGRLRQT